MSRWSGERRSPHGPNERRSAHGPNKGQAPRGRNGTRMPRGQVEPTVALVATVSVCLSLGLYAVAIGDVMPSTDRDLAPTTLDRIYGELRQGGVVVPERRASAHDAGPAGYELNLTVRAAGRHWNSGPPAPDRADRATRQSSVRVGDDRIRAGRLEVAVWS